MLARFALHGLVAQLRSIEVEIEKLIEAVASLPASDQRGRARRLATILGIGPITASAIAASVPDASTRRCSGPVASSRPSWD